jgi:hypothetical protein
MNAAFFGLAFLAALNPKLFAVDLLLMGNERPRLMFLSFLLGGLAICIGIGLLDVFVFRADAVQAQGSASAGLDLALGMPLVIIGALLAADRLHRPGRPPAGSPGPARAKKPKKEGWARRVLREPRFGIAILIGAIAGTPGASYVAALHDLFTGKSSTATQAIAVIIFAIIEFSLVIVPFVFLEIRPEGTKAQVQRFQNWLMTHARQLMAAVALFVGAYMAISGLVRLLT